MKGQRYIMLSAALAAALLLTWGVSSFGVSAAAPVTTEAAWRIEITQDGLYRLDYDGLRAAGVPVTGHLATDFHLYWRGQPVAVEVRSSGAEFSPGDSLVFYGQKFHGSRQDEKYTDANVYWLKVEPTSPSPQMISRSVAPDGAAPQGICSATMTTEQDMVYWARWSDQPRTSATWFWERVDVPAGVLTHSYPLTLHTPLTAGHALLRVEFASRNYKSDIAPDHHVRLTLNGTSLGDFYWDGKIGHIITTSVPAVALKDGQNTLAVAYCADVGFQTVYFDRATITYPRQPSAVDGQIVCSTDPDGSQSFIFTGLTDTAAIYDVGQPLRPVRLTGAVCSGGTCRFKDTPSPTTRYLAASPTPITPTLYYLNEAALLTPTIGADEIIIAPQAFITALQPLVAQRTAQGLRVQVTSVEDVFSVFNGGIFHPQAIHDFMAYAYAHWHGPPVRDLFLVGDGNFNFKGYNPAKYGTFTPSLIPPYLAFADPSQGEVPLDSYFGDVNDDGFPEIAVGRLPAQTITEVHGYVQKVLSYEAQPPAAWQTHIFMVADDGKTSDEGFSRILDGLMRDYLPASVTTQTAYMADACHEAGRPNSTSCPTETHAITTGWNAGAAWLTYAGHGSIHRWGHEHFLLNTQVAQITTDKLPFLLSLDCWDGYWMFPPQYPPLKDKDVRSIGEWATTVITSSGAIAAFGPAGLGYANEEERLARAMYQAAFEHGVFELGRLTQIGRQAIHSSYLARTYTLLGDPAVQFPWQATLHLEPQIKQIQVGHTLHLGTMLPATGTTRFGQTFTITPTWTKDGEPLPPTYTVPTTAGEFTLTAHLGTVQTSIHLTATAGEPVTLTVSPNPLTLMAGQTVHLTATPLDAYGNPTTATSPIVWDSDIGTIDAQGWFTAPLSAGSGRITATMTILSGTNTLALTAYAPVNVRILGEQIFLPLVLRTP